jgi:hypothetical protein
MFYGSQIDTQGVEFTRYETQTPIESMLEYQVPEFSIKLDVENITF